MKSDGFWLGLAVATFAIWASHTWGGLWRDPNEYATFGKTGLPKNCRAVIQANLDAWHSNHYTPNEILSSIERNCSVIGYSWNPK